MSRTLLTIGLLLLALAVLIAFFTQTRSSHSGEDLNLQNPLAAPDGERGVVAAGSGSEASTAGEVTPCVSIEEFVAGPEGYRLDSWFMSWGAPPVGDTPDSASAYSWYDDETLLEMGRAGDPIAKHERGRRLVISALTGVINPPADSTIWDVDSPELPLGQSIDSSKLNTGREVLFEAAVLGRTYALIEIAISYALEQQVVPGGEDSNFEALAELKIKSFSFGESVELLVPGLHTSFFQSSLPRELKPVADQELEEIVGRVISERSERGVILPHMDEETATLFDSLEICRD